MSDTITRIGSVVGLLAMTSMSPVPPTLWAQDQGKARAGFADQQKAQPNPTVTPQTEAIQRPSPFGNRKPSVQSSPTFTVPVGTDLSVRLGETLDTRRAQAGDRFSATLDAAIQVRGRVVVPKGTVFSGYVAEAKPSGRFRGRGVLSLTLDSFRLRGATYHVQTAPDVHRSGDHKKRDAALVAGSTGLGAVAGKISGVGAAIGAGAGAAAGTTTAIVTGRRNVTLPIETPLVFSLSRNVNVRG